MKQHISRIRSAATILDDYGQRLGLEFVGPKTFRDGHLYPFVFDLKGILSLIKEVNCRNVGMIMDSFHLYTSGGKIDDIKTIDCNLAIHAHLSDIIPGISIDQQMDRNRRMPHLGGIVDNVGFLSTLNEIGYDGPVSAEPFACEETSALSNDEIAIQTFDILSGLFREANIKF